MNNKLKKRFETEVFNRISTETFNREYALNNSVEEIEKDVWQIEKKANYDKLVTAYFINRPNIMEGELSATTLATFSQLDAICEQNATVLAENSINKYIQRRIDYCTKILNMSDEEFEIYLQTEITSKLTILTKMKAVAPDKIEFDYDQEAAKIRLIETENRKLIRDTPFAELESQINSKNRNQGNFTLEKKRYLKSIVNNYIIRNNAEVSELYQPIFDAINKTLETAATNITVEEEASLTNIQKMVDYYLELSRLDETEFALYLDKIVAEIEQDLGLNTKTSVIALCHKKLILKKLKCFPKNSK